MKTEKMQYVNVIKEKRKFRKITSSTGTLTVIKHRLYARNSTCVKFYKKPIYKEQMKLFFMFLNKNEISKKRCS